MFLTSFILQVCNSFLSLKDKCISASTNAPYVKSIVGGRDISIEGKQVIEIPTLEPT